MGISQTAYIIKKYEDYNFEQLLMSNFIYKAWKEAYDRGFEIDIEDELDEIVFMKNLVPIYEMDDMDSEKRPTLREMAYFGKNPVIFSLVKEKVEAMGLEMKEYQYAPLSIDYISDLVNKCTEFAENNPEDLGIKSAIHELNEVLDFFKDKNSEDYFILYSFA